MIQKTNPSEIWYFILEKKISKESCEASKRKEYISFSFVFNQFKAILKRNNKVQYEKLMTSCECNRIDVRAIDIFANKMWTQIESITVTVVELQKKVANR